MINETKVAVITGAGSGIGRAAALVFAKAGYRVALLDQNGAAVEQTLSQVRLAGGEGISLICDVSDSSSVTSCHDTILVRLGRIDAAVNAAGLEGDWLRLTEETPELFDRIIGVNLKGVWSCMAAQIPALQRNSDGGSIVNISSGAGLVGSSRSAIYSASKHGVVGLTKSAALQYASEGIRINAICPGGVDTPMANRIRSSAPNPANLRGRSGVALGRDTTPEEVAATALWLCSPAAASIIGVALPVDGGLTAA